MLFQINIVVFYIPKSFNLYNLQKWKYYDLTKFKGGFYPVGGNKIDFFFFALSDRYTFQKFSQKYLSHNL